jgi:hypothetical protein
MTFSNSDGINLVINSSFTDVLDFDLDSKEIKPIYSAALKDQDNFQDIGSAIQFKGEIYIIGEYHIHIIKVETMKTSIVKSRGTYYAN